MKTTTQSLPDQQFNEKLDHANRVWNGEEGLSKNQAIHKGIDFDEITTIFVRDDGWSIACRSRDYGSCLQLWERAWETIYIRS